MKHIRRWVIAVAATVMLVSLSVWDAGPPSRAAISPEVLGADAPYVHGLLSSPIGGFIHDEYGRVVILHGVNAVYKHPPYALSVAPGKAWNFSDKDATRIASLGFNIVRLGIIWAGIEPGNLGPNNPAICTPGTPSDPNQWNQSTADAYLAKVKQTVDLLAKHHVYTLLDMHEDVYSSVFGGEGAPPWAVCTGDEPITRPPGRWSNVYGTPALNTAVGHFWTNDVVGDLQGEYDRSWAAVAQVFKDDPWVVGYDPINEPFTKSISPLSPEDLDVQLECFYTGTSEPGKVLDSTQILNCPPSDPQDGLIPTIRAVDPDHLIFREPSITSLHGAPNYVGAMPFPNLVLNFHDYCSYRSPVTGNPYNLPACVAQEESTFIRRAEEGPLIATTMQPLGLPLFMSEFGATQSVALLQNLTAIANQTLVGWCYWSWKYYGDPTGSSAEALATPTGQLRPIAKVLSQPYPQAVAGSLALMRYDAATHDFYLNYSADKNIKAPTLIAVPRRNYPQGFCGRTSAGQVRTFPNAIEVTSPRADATVEVTVTPGACPRRPKGSGSSF